MTKHLTNLTLEELTAIIIELGGKKYLAKQIWDWIYKKNILEFYKMSDVSIKFRELLKTKFNLGIYKLKEQKSSSDGTEKFLLELED
ncbi:MAG: 23S rRNA (adenine(2503)-C(2))-methyltransferase RlmN, partial [Candidatus Delongbacteria bacterium]|nr:23S rRNA (adenine(2503)-C(2))-methyltransferase RlmN [Candidatus Delongbacteria bacterium]